MPRPKQAIKIRRGPRGVYLVEFAVAPGRTFSTPIPNAVGDSEEGRGPALAWAKRNQARLLAADEKPLALRHFAAAFFAPDGEWASRMRDKGHKFGAAYLANRQSHLDCYVLPLFGDMDPRDLDGRYIDDAIRAAKSKAGRELAPATKYRIVYSLNLVLADLVERKILAANPLTGIKAYSRAPVRPRGAIPPATLESLFPAGHGPLVRVWGGSMWAACMLVLLDTGMRPGELRALTWSRLYGEERAFVVRHGIAAGTVATVKGTKTDQVRTPAISLRTAQELAIWRAESRHAGEGDFIFSLDGAAPVTGAAIVKAFRRGLAEVGVEAKAWTPYWLRHSFVTHSLAVLSEEEVAALAGHSVEVSRIYQHPDDELALLRSRTARAKLDAARG